MDKEPVESRWIHCPICNGKTRTKVYADTAMFNFPLYCPKCKKEIRIDVMQLKMAISKCARRKNAEPAFPIYRNGRLCFYFRHSTNADPVPFLAQL